MRLLGLAVQGNTIRFRTLFDLEFPQLGPGTYKAQKPTVVDYAIAVHSHARGSDPEGIAYWMKRMSDDGIQPNLHVYSSIIQSYLRSGNLGAVADVLNEMREAGVAPNVVIYTDIITALSRHHKPSTAEGIFKRALQENIKPDQAMVGALLNCYVEAGQWDEAVTLFRSLEANTRSPLHLTIEMYNIALKGYVIMGAPFRVVATLFERLDADEDVAPTDITFALLLQSACESGYMRAAMDIFKEMDRRATEGAKGLINPYIFTILMSGLLRKGNRDEAMVVYREMLNRGLEPTSVTFNTVLRYYSNERSEESLRLTYEFMERVARREEEEQAPILAEGNLRLSPTQLVFEPVLRECATSGDVEGFERVLGDMLDAGGQIGMVTLTALLDLYRRKSRLESATKVWEHLLSLGDEAMQAARFLVDGKEDIESRTDMLCVSLTIYLGMLSEIGEHERVLQTWQTYQQKGFSFNFFNWNSLGSYLIRAGEYERAFEILDRIILPYIRIVRNQKDRSPPATVNAKEKPEEIWRTPFEVLNKTNLSFLQSTILPNRPLTSSSRVKVMRRRSFRDNEEIFTSLALKPTSRPGASSSPQPPPSSPPSTSSNDTVQSTPSSASSAEPEESEKPTDPSPSSPSIPLHPGSAATREPLDPSNIPNFVRPLWLMSQSNSSSAPRVHFSLFRHLLMGYQRLRAGQPPLASSQASGDNMYSTEYSPEQQEMSRAQLGKIVEKYPDAVAAVLDFEQQERVRLGDNYEKTYFWG
jgi:pentatricopeptide repeat protein